MDNQPIAQNSASNQSNGQVKVDIFALDKGINGLLDKLKNDLEALTKAFDQNRNAIRLLADMFSDGGGSGLSGVDLSKFEQAGIDISQVLKGKITEQALLIDKIATERGIKSHLAEQFTHYDDRHTGAEAKNELLEDVETQLMSTIYNQINELRSKIEAYEVAAANTPAVNENQKQQ